MMRIFNYPKRELWDDLCRRPLMDTSGLDDTIRGIFGSIREYGDRALIDFTLKFDRAAVKKLKVPVSDIEQSFGSVPSDIKDAIKTASSNIAKFHKSQLRKEYKTETSPGVKCWRKSVPIEIAGIYIPGGSAPLFSTVLMLAIPAKIAGCKRIILCTPPGSNGKINDLILYSARISGVTDIFSIGGAQAIAAMAYGTETVPRVDKIFGPGNQYVTRAKELVQIDGIPIDMPAGPSEVLIIADEKADPAFVAADLIAQAEHGSDSQVVCLSTSGQILRSVEFEVEKQLEKLPRKNIAEKSLSKSMLICLESLNDCMAFSNKYAPEHLILSVDDPASLSEMVTNAGSVFLGKYSCESAGDYATGTNHTLPTNGFARNFSGVAVESFMKKITFQELSAGGIGFLGPVIEKMAEAENLTGHKNAVTLRLKSLEK